MKLTVDRSKVRFGMNRRARLYYADTNQVDLFGLLAMECGYTLDDIKTQREPAAVAILANSNKWPKGVLETNPDNKFTEISHLTYEALRACDMLDSQLSAKLLGEVKYYLEPEYRERYVAEKMAALGVELEFTGEYGKPELSGLEYS